jgi:heavy metal sensor kinase
MTLFYTALLALVIVAVAVFLVLRLRVDLIGAIDDGLGPAAAQIAHDYRLEGVPEFRDSSGTVLKGDRAASQLLSSDGRVLATFGDAVSARPLLTPRDLRNGIRQLTRRGFRVAAVPVTYKGADQFVVTAQSTREMRTSLRRLITLLAIAIPAALLIVGAGGWWLAGRALRPIGRIASTAEAIGPDRLTERVEHRRTADEVGRLADAFNTMLDRIERAVGEQRRLVADASHELRTPLAAIRAEIDVSLRFDDLGPNARRVLISAREEIERMSRTVADLLTLAAADEFVYRLDLEPQDLDAIAAGVVGTLEPLAVQRDVRLVHTAGGAKALADREEIGRAVRNLVENAIRHSPPGGVVTVSSRNGAVEVEDDGPGIPADMRDRVFDRFVRLDRARGRATGGSGLGLAIVKQIAEAHGGRVWVRPRQPHGSSFVIDLPQR